MGAFVVLPTQSVWWRISTLPSGSPCAGMASLMLAEALKRLGRQGPSTAVGEDSRSSSPEQCTGPRASALCLLCHFHLKIYVDAAVTQLGRVPSFPLVMAQSAGQ
jgi:hypothetical protein